MMRVPLFEDELALSFLARTAIANGSRSLAAFCSDAGHDPRAVARGDPEALGELAALAGVSGEELSDRLVNSVKAAEVDFIGEVYSARHLSSGFCQFCPECLAEDEQDVRRMPGTRRYARIVWSFRCLHACDRHGIAYLPAGGGIFRPRSFDLLHATTSSAVGEVTLHPRLALSPTRFESFVVQRLSGFRGHGAMLDVCSLPAAIELCELAGLADMFGRSFRLGAARGVTRTALERGYELLAEGVPLVERLLEALSKSRRFKAVATSVTLFGTLAAKMARPALSSTPLAAAIKRHALLHHPEISPAAFPAGETGVFSSVRKIAAAGDAPDRVAHAYLARHGLIRLDVPYDPEVMVEEVVARAAAETLGETATFGNVLTLLECDPCELENLVYSGLLTPLIGGRGFDATFADTDRYLRAQVKDLLSALTAFPAEGARRLSSVRLTVRQLGCDLDEALRAVLSGRMERLGFDRAKPLFEGLKVDPDEFRDALGLHGMIGASAVRRRLSLSRPLMHRLVGDGILRAHVDGRAGTTVFAPKDIDHFERRYVSLEALAIERGMSVAEIRVKVTLGGRIPVVFDAVASNPIYLRSAVRETAGSAKSRVDVGEAEEPGLIRPIERSCRRFVASPIPLPSFCRRKREPAWSPQIAAL
ncbi:TniQ protein [Rhizobium sp. PP-CC-2G-626]|nr:TniQ protein [Rhizobium sp. PP-CC-2G-626]